MDSQTTLKPCPFCGGDAEEYCTPTWQYWVYCELCQIKFTGVSRVDVANVWNRLAPVECVHDLVRDQTVTADFATGKNLGDK